MKAIALSVTLLALPALAQCAPLSACFCFSPTRVGVVVTETIDQARATVRVESAATGLDAGMVLEVPREAGEAVGARWLVLDLQRRAVDDAGTVGCGSGSPNTPRVAVGAAALAVTHAGCDEELSAQGFVLNGCHDTGRACSVTPLLALPLAVLALALRRRRRL